VQRNVFLHKPEGTVSVMSSDPQCTDDHARIRTVPVRQLKKEINGEV